MVSRGYGECWGIGTYFPWNHGYTLARSIRSGSFQATPSSTKGTHGYRKFISDLSEDIDKENDLARASQLLLQGNWIRWCDYVRMDLSRKTLLAMPSPLVSFCIQSTQRYSSFSKQPLPLESLIWLLVYTLQYPISNSVSRVKWL